MREQAETTEKRILKGTHSIRISIRAPRADLALTSKRIDDRSFPLYLRLAQPGTMPLTPGEDRLPRSSSIRRQLGQPILAGNLVAQESSLERQGIGAHIDEEEPGFTVHRSGLDVAQRLLLRRACGEDRTQIRSSIRSGLGNAAHRFLNRPDRGQDQ